MTAKTLKITAKERLHCEDFAVEISPSNRALRFHCKGFAPMTTPPLRLNFWGGGEWSWGVKLRALLTVKRLESVEQSHEEI